jgi:hypothetical protein
MAARRALFQSSNSWLDVCIALEDVVAVVRDEGSWIVHMRQGGHLYLSPEDGQRLRDVWRQWCSGE